LENYLIINTGDTIYGSTDTFTAPEGSKSLKVWGQFTGWANETPIYQSFAATTGQTYTLTGRIYQHPDDPIIGDQTYAALAVKFYTADYGDSDIHESDHFVSSSPTDAWVELTATGTVPDGFTIAQAAVEFMHCYGEAEGDCSDGGAVYFDELSFSTE
ncbi:MAG: hypothetical protein GXP62_07670, partial [Oligoflexia bacterium]|nr:hypothetical protein [Oligoflexia bacterium]